MRSHLQGDHFTVVSTDHDFAFCIRDSCRDNPANCNKSSCRFTNLHPVTLTPFPRLYEKFHKTEQNYKTDPPDTTDDIKMIITAESALKHNNLVRLPLDTNSTTSSSLSDFIPSICSPSQMIQVTHHDDDEFNEDDEHKKRFRDKRFVDIGNNFVVALNTDCDHLVGYNFDTGRVYDDFAFRMNKDVGDPLFEDEEKASRFLGTNHIPRNKMFAVSSLFFEPRYKVVSFHFGFTNPLNDSRISVQQGMIRTKMSGKETRAPKTIGTSGAEVIPAKLMHEIINDASNAYSESAKFHIRFAPVYSTSTTSSKSQSASDDVDADFDVDRPCYLLFVLENTDSSSTYTAYGFMTFRFQKGTPMQKDHLLLAPHKIEPVYIPRRHGGMLQPPVFSQVPGEEEIIYFVSAEYRDQKRDGAESHKPVDKLVGQIHRVNVKTQRHQQAVMTGSDVFSGSTRFDDIEPPVLFDMQAVPREWFEKSSTTTTTRNRTIPTVVVLSSTALTAYSDAVNREHSREEFTFQDSFKLSQPGKVTDGKLMTCFSFVPSCLSPPGVCVIAVGLQSGEVSFFKLFDLSEKYCRPSSSLISAANDEPNIKHLSTVQLNWALPLEGARHIMYRPIQTLKIFPYIQGNQAQPSPEIGIVANGQGHLYCGVLVDGRSSTEGTEEFTRFGKYKILWPRQPQSISIMIGKDRLKYHFRFPRFRNENRSSVILDVVDANYLHQLRNKVGDDVDFVNGRPELLKKDVVNGKVEVPIGALISKSFSKLH